jgi:Tol biopolymer transport system component
MALAILAALAILFAFVAESAHAAFPGKPGPIVYRKTFAREGDDGRFRTTGGLFVHGPRLGGSPRQLSFDPDDQGASFSANGRKIVFESFDRFSPGIYVMNSDGSGRTLVTDDGTQPAFFPDSRRIAFMRDGRIFSIRIDGSGLRQITGPPFPDHEPVVSPDGRTIAFVKTRRNNEAIFVVGSNGGRPRPLIDLPSDDDDPEWAPDGRRLVFTGNRRGCGAGIYVARADGSRIRRLTPCERSGKRIYNHPAFSPDGRHVVAIAYRGGTKAIVLMRSDGGGIVGTVDRGHPKEEGVRVDVDIASWGPRPR